MDTTLKGFPFAEPDDAITDYPATSQALAEEIERNTCVLYDSGVLAGAGSLDSGTLVIPAGVKSCRIIAKGRKSTNVTGSAYLRFNNDSSLVYDYSYAGRIVTAMSSAGSLGMNAWAIPDFMAGNHLTAGKVSVLDMVILDAFVAGMAKTGTGTFGSTTDTSGNVSTGTYFGNYYPAGLAALSRIAILPGADSFGAGSRMLILGMK
jgi:hypothetical protein